MIFIGRARLGFIIIPIGKAVDDGEEKEKLVNIDCEETV